MNDELHPTFPSDTHSIIKSIIYLVLDTYLNIFLDEPPSYHFSITLFNRIIYFYIQTNRIFFLIGQDSTQSLSYVKGAKTGSKITVLFLSY